LIKVKEIANAQIKKKNMSRTTTSKCSIYTKKLKEL